PNLYNPARLNTDQWLEAAKAMGGRYAILTATHHQGFLQWQSDAYPFGLKQTKWRNGKADIVKDFVESCRKYDIKPGLYIGIRFNAYWQVYNYKVNGGKGGNQKKHAQYMRVCEQIVEELCSRYGPLCEIWFDGGVVTPQQGGPDVLPIVEKYQPNAVFYHSLDRAEHRWAGSESGATGYPCFSTMPSVASQIRAHTDQKKRITLLKHGDPDGNVWCPAMADAPIREHDWLWIPNSEHKLQPLDKLVDMYYKSAGRNANLIVGAVPDTDGLIPEADFERYAEFGGEIRRRFNRPLARTEGQGTIVELKFKQPARFNHVVIMEDIAQGERTREYVVEALVSGGEWRNICDGISIGHKRIQHFESLEAAKVRLRITKSIARPIIRGLAAYNVT
ncbi:MAG: alpha-L-fucosidase, partial [Planctomycetota bacterium]|nr:alpha-L-fucosidase [Planctomycetota bacterium]